MRSAALGSAPSGLTSGSLPSLCISLQDARSTSLFSSRVASNDARSRGNGFGFAARQSRALAFGVNAGSQPARPRLRFRDTYCVAEDATYDELLTRLMEITARAAVACCIDEPDWEHEQLRRRGLSALDIFRNGRLFGPTARLSKRASKRTRDACDLMDGVSRNGLIEDTHGVIRLQAALKFALSHPQVPPAVASGTLIPMLAAMLGKVDANSVARSFCLNATPRFESANRICGSTSTRRSRSST